MARQIPQGDWMKSSDHDLQTLNGHKVENDIKGLHWSKRYAFKRPNTSTDLPFK